MRSGRTGMTGPVGDPDSLQRKKGVDPRSIYRMAQEARPGLEIQNIF